MNILFINLPPASTKKSGNPLYWLQASMNLGLLAVASAASRAGHECFVYDWLGDHQFPLLERLTQILEQTRPDIVGLSLPSGYGELLCGPVAKIVKGLSPSTRIVVGGQYHAGMRGQRLLERFPDLDAVAIGDGESLDWHHVLSCELANPPPGVITRLSPLSRPSTTKSSKILFPEYRFGLNQLDIRSYAPSIEIARGCPFTCSFCSLSGAPSSLDQASSGSIVQQLRFWEKTWPKLDRIPVYFECPVFFSQPNNIDAFAACLDPFKDRIEWRVQCRVDSVRVEVLPRLYELGLRIIDLGLESASERMLTLMNKAPKPERYLRQAQDLIDAAANCGIGVKLNILLFPGETYQTAAETEAFIHRNRDKIWGIAASGAIEFPGSDLSEKLEFFRQQYGTARRFDPQVSPAGIYPLDLSHDFSLDEARAWCLRTTRSVTTAESYYRLKRIGYFRPEFTFTEFMDVVRASDAKHLPFEVKEAHDPSMVNTTSGWDVAEWDQLR